MSNNQSFLGDIKMKLLKSLIIYILLIVLLLSIISCTTEIGEEKINNNNIKKPADYSIVVYGDTRTNHSVHQAIVDRILLRKPDVVFHTGDLVTNGRKEKQWKTFNEITENLCKLCEFFPALGNHENNAKLYFDNFELPNNEIWYSIEINNIHFIVLDSNTSLQIDSEQYNWLENDLKNIDRDKIKFVAAIFHHPPFSTGISAEDEKHLRKSIIPLFEKYYVDIVFNGHDHCYERCFYNGIYYIVTGGGGAPLYWKSRRRDYSQLFIKKYHYCELYIENDKLIMNVFDINLNIIDNIEID